ncbi:MAG: chemotaxis response regulator protein-glutamate methylesterase [Verrucomicrobiota bacterium]
MRVAIVNDMPMAVEIMSRLLTQSPGYQVAWTAGDGHGAIARCAEDRPDLILMDLVMPGLSGAETIRHIMLHTPCPILIVTGSVESHTSKVFEALGAGALDVVTTPVAGAEEPGEWGSALLAKLRMLSRLVTRRTLTPPAESAPDKPERSMTRNRLVVIGASAGGPAALATVLGSLPRDFPASIVIIQHVDAQFSGLLAKWLNGQSALPVRLAVSGERPQPGTALLAGTNDHLVFAGPHGLSYIPEPETCPYRPSVDVFFESAARHWKGEVAAVLLTGMGRDGAKGLKALRDRGALTIAQDQASCIVYGMPKAAVALGAAAEVLPLDLIGPRLARFFPPPGFPSHS